MAYISYHHSADASPATPRFRIVWGRVGALAFSVGAWAMIIAGVRALF